MELDYSNIYDISDAAKWRQFIGSTNAQGQFVGFPLALVMYESSMCHNCTEAMPVVSELAGTYKGIIRVGVVDLAKLVIAGSELAPGQAEGKTMVSGVGGTPEFWMYRLGKAVDSIRGRDDDKLRKMFAYWAQQYPK